MKKFICCAFCALILFSAAGVSACKSAAKRCLYEITAEYVPAERTLSAEMTVSVPNPTETALSELKFELWGNAYREDAAYRPLSEPFASAAYYAGESYGGMNVVSVTGAANYAVGGEDENILTVSLLKDLYPDESVTITIGYELTLAEVNHRLGVGENNVTLGNFYPVLCAYDGGFLEYVYAENGDPFVSECADYRVTLTVPAQFALYGGGEIVRTESDDKAVYTVTAENTRDIALVLSDRLSAVSTGVTIGGRDVTVEYAYFSDETPETTLSAAADSLRYFSQTFGDYAYPRYTLVQTDFPYGGMEYSSFVLLSSSLAEGDIPTVVAHETAHQWWYAMVGSNQFEAAWQDEGLAEFSAALFLEAYPVYGGSYDAFVRGCENGYRAFFSVKSQLNGEADTSMTRPLTSFSGAYEYRNIAYDKGVILFDRVKSVVGEKKLIAGLKTYFGEYAGKIASPEELIACFGGGSNAAAMMKSFLDGTCVI